MKYFSKTTHQTKANNKLQKAAILLIKQFDRKFYETRYDANYAVIKFRNLILNLNAEHKNCKPLNIDTHDNDGDIIVGDPNLFSITFYKENTK